MDMALIFKNRTHYTQPTSATPSVPTSWEEQIVNREIVWKLGMDGLHYKVIGERINIESHIVNPDYKQVVLFEGLKKNVYKPDTDLLQALGDAWAASVLLGDGEAYRGTNNAVQTPETPQVMMSSTGPYPYFD